MLDFIFLDILDTATMSPSAPEEDGGPIIESNTRRAAACVEAARLLAGQSSCTGFKDINNDIDKQIVEALDPHFPPVPRLLKSNCVRN